MYNDTYVFKFSMAEVIRLENQVRLVEAIFRQHNDNARRYLLRDRDTTVNILREAQRFIDANIAKDARGLPTVWPRITKGMSREEYMVFHFRPDATTVYRLMRGADALKNIYSQFTIAEQNEKIEVVLRSPESGNAVPVTLSVQEMYARVRSVLVALMDNVRFWDGRIS